MHQPRRVRGILTQPISLIRAFLLCLLLASSQLPALTGFFSIAEAAGHAHGGAIHPHIVHALNNSHVVSKLARPDVVTSAKHGHSHHSAADSLHRTVHPHLLKGHGLHAAMGPDLSVSLTGSSSLTLGAPATFTFSATNVAAASTASDTSTQPLLALSTPLIATIALPVGFTNVTATAADPTQWNVIANGTLVTATYTGSQPIQTGQVLPAITVTGTPTASLLNLPRNLQAVTGTIVAPGDVNLGNNTASVPLNVAQPVAVAATADPAVTANSVASTSPTVTANSAASTNSTTRSTSASAPGSVDVTLDNVMLNSANLSVGRPVTYNLTVSAASDSATINSGTPITVEDVVPLGLSNIVASASSGWSFAVSNTTSPSNVVATYNGAYPITPGSVLPIITIMGTLDSNVAAPFTNTANVLVANNSNRGMSSFSINVPGVAPAVSAPAVSTPAVSTPAVSTPAVSAPAVSASAVSTPAVSAPAVSAPVVGMTNAPLANTDVTAVSDPTIIVVSPTVAGSSTSAPTTPALSLTKVSTGMSSTYSVGDRITYMLTAQDLATGADESQPITVQDIVPAGLTNITVTGRNWSVNEPASTSPVILSATYTGAYPVAAGTSLPPIIVSGVLTQEAATAGSFSTTADVSSSDDPGSALTAAVDTISMQAAPQASGDSSSPSPSVNATTIVTAANTVNATTTVTAADTVNATTTVTAADTVNDAAPVNGVATVNAAAPVNGVATVNAAAPVNGAAPMNGPDLSVVKTSVNGDHYHVGDTVTFVLVVSNAPGAGTIADPSTISLEDVLPLGLKNIHVHGKLWNVISSGSASPTIIDANFTGLAPVTGGAVLPALIITGELIDDATPSFTSTAYVDVPNDANTNDKIASYTVFVHKHHNNNNDNNNNDNNNNDNNNNDNNNNHNNHNNHNNNNNNNNNNNFHTRVGVGTRVGIVIRRRSCVVTCGFPGLPGTGSDPFDDR